MPISTCSRRRWFVVAAILAIIETAVLPGGVESARADVGDPYPLANCVVQDMELDRRARVIDDDGREIRVCCKDCVEEFEDNFHTWIAVVDERIMQQQRGLYPLTKCVVDGEPLENALTIDVVFRNRLFRLCSPECQEKLEKDPKTYFAKLNQAVIEKQKPDYPLDTCIVSGKPLGTRRSTTSWPTN